MFTRKGYFILNLWLIFLLLASSRTTCGAVPGQSNPMGLIRTGTQRAIQILYETQSGRASSLRQRKAEILDVVSQYFNFEEMAKRALGHAWKDQPADKRQRFVQLFKQLLFNTYINRLENYTGSSEQVSYDSEKLDGDYALVKTHILYQGASNVSIDYRLRRDGSAWKVYDVVVEGISIVENYRSQFSSILANESFDSLLKRLQEKVEQSG
jgi:phospholipid transport system substrate-binding protein